MIATITAVFRISAGDGRWRIGFAWNVRQVYLLPCNWNGMSRTTPVILVRIQYVCIAGIFRYCCCWHAGFVSSMPVVCKCKLPIYIFDGFFAPNLSFPLFLFFCFPLCRSSSLLVNDTFGRMRRRRGCVVDEIEYYIQHLHNFYVHNVNIQSYMGPFARLVMRISSLWGLDFSRHLGTKSPKTLPEKFSNFNQSVTPMKDEWIS